MEYLRTPYGNLIIHAGCHADLREHTVNATNTIIPKNSFRDMVMHDHYASEIRRDCRLALDRELIATPDELAIAQRILSEHLDVDAAQALLQ